MAANSLRVNFSWVLIGNTVYTMCQGGMLIVLAKLTSPEMVGEFALALAITAPVFLFLNLHLRYIQATDARQEYAFGHYLALRTLTSILAIILICGITLAMRLEKETALVTWVVALAKGLEAMSEIYYGCVQRQERMDKIAKSLIMKGTLSISVLTAAIYFSGQVLWGVVGMALVTAVILAGYDSRVMNEGGEALDEDKSSREGRGSLLLEARWEWSRLWSLALLALPMGAAILVTNLQVNVPRYFIEKFLGTRQLGFFAAMAYPMAAGAVVINALGLSASPRMARYYSEGKYPHFTGLLVKLILLGVLVGGAGVAFALIFGRRFLEIVYKPEYAEHSDLFVLIMLTTAIQYSVIFVGTALNVLRRFVIKMFVHTVGLVFLFSLCMWWSGDSFSLKDAVIAVLITSAVEALIFGAIIIFIIGNKREGQTERLASRACKKGAENAPRRDQMSITCSIEEEYT